MPGLSDLLCGCTLTNLARASSTTIEAPVQRQASSSSAAPRGLVQVCHYEATPEDDLDVQVSLQLMAFDRSLAADLLMRRLGPGEYELDGRRVRVSWAPATEGGIAELLVQEATREGDEVDGECAKMPLLAYFKQVADVAASLGGRSVGAPTVARVPVKERLTFTAGPQNTIDDMGMERLRSMRVACEQARLREHAAEEYEREREREASVTRQLSPEGFGARIRSASQTSIGSRDGFGPQMRSASQTSLGSRVRVLTPESRSGAAPIGNGPLTGMLAGAGATRAHLPLGSISARAGSPPIVAARPQQPLGSFARAQTPPPPLPSRSNSAHVLPSHCRTGFSGSMPPLPVPVPVVVVDKQLMK